MNDSKNTFIRIQNANENNLKNISLEIPHGKLIVVTGVSGSGKSTLAFDVIAKEGQRRFLETFSSFSRQFIGKISRPNVESIEGLSPVITIGQKTVSGNVRSTVGTISDLYDFLRLIFARIGKTDENIKLTRSLFSFNTPIGACPTCKGIGLEEKISVKKLIADENKTLREGALAPSLPNGYIMYSQVTIEVLNQVCNAHGFNVDIAWKDLTDEQKDVILYGSTKIKVPFGKHSLESRLKWTGITAKPREEDYYKGMIPIMSDILRRDRNDNILRYAESLTCSACNGKRLNESALSVKINDATIDELSAMELSELKLWSQKQKWATAEVEIATPIVDKIIQQISLLEKLGVGYLHLNRASDSLSGGEAQRIRLVNQLSSKLSNILYVFDEPSIGMHARDNNNMLEILRMLVQNRNTVIVVEHDEQTIRQADWIIDIGPRAGIHGGELLFNGSVDDFLNNDSLKGKSPTYDALKSEDRTNFILTENSGSSFIELKSCKKNNLKDIDVKFKTGALNVVTGVSGTGKSSLVHGVLENAILKNEINAKEIIGIDKIDKLIQINQAPIGRTPRSNPATYTGLADKIRDIFAKQESSKKLGFSKSRFSFNTKGGRCENCQGAGRIQIGMHFLGNVDVVCSVCNGKRFNEETLEITYKGKNINQVFDLSVNQAIEFFKDEKSVQNYLQTLKDVGLGYVKLGQPSTTLSGGEAQRIKLASELQKKDTGNTLYILDEPTIGLHIDDIKNLIKVLKQITAKGNTIVCIEHDKDIIYQADWLIDLGPESGASGGNLIFQGKPKEIINCANSITGKALAQENKTQKNKSEYKLFNHIELKGVTTNQLKNIDVRIPKNKLTVITGVSGSGKSSLAFDTLYAEAQSRFTESLSTYARSLLKQSNQAKLEYSSGLGPVVAISRKYLAQHSRSTVGTITGLYDHYRLLFSRLAQSQGKDYTAQHFSFNHELGACPKCNGLGVQLTCDLEKLINAPEKSILDGAINGSKPGKFYGDVNGQYIATLKTVCNHFNIDISKPVNQLNESELKILLYGTGEQVWDVNWEYKNKTRSGQHQLKAKWLGFCNYIDDEFQRRLHNKNIESLEELLHEKECSLCKGGRLKQELLDVHFLGKNIVELSNLSFVESEDFFENALKESLTPHEKAIVEEISNRIFYLLNVLQKLGLGYLSVSRKSTEISGGEGQRLRLAGALSSKLYGVTYVLDEPTIGLHTKDIIPLTKIVKDLINNGNTVVVVEHDETFIREADYIIEMGPKAGNLGGNIIAQGTVKDIENNLDSLTGAFLKNPTPQKFVKRNVIQSSFGVKEAYLHNLKNIDVDFISKGIIAVTGVSGSGKTTLVQHVLLNSALKKKAYGCENVFGLEKFDRIISVDQQSVSTSHVSTTATFIGLMDALRDFYADLAISKKLKFKKSHFSFHHKDGKCPDCNGYGQQKTSMDFMSDVWTVCETCNGTRYKDEILQSKFNDKSISDILEMTVDEVVSIYINNDKILNYLKTLQDVGIGHLKLGQNTNSLSGGEAQRLKLASELIHHRNGQNLYVFDEPTTGLHYFDIQKLITLFNKIVDEGHTILFIEHNPLLISIANQIIELGPESGERGGKLIQNKAL